MLSKLFKRHDCSKDGHRTKTYERRGLVPPDRSQGWTRAVVEEVYQQRTVCCKCKQQTGWITVRSDDIHRLTATPEIWKAIDGGGSFDGAYRVKNDAIYHTKVSLPNAEPKVCERA